MILHVVVFAWNDGISVADIERLEIDLARLAHDAGAVWFETARDGGFRDESADFAVVARFADEAGLRTYLAHPDHERILSEYARAMVARKEGLQAVVPGA